MPTFTWSRHSFTQPFSMYQQYSNNQSSWLDQINPQYILIALFVLFIIWLLYRKDPYPVKIYSHWDTYFPDLQFSTHDFYSSVQTIMEKRQIPDAKYFTVAFSERSDYGRKRIYLRVVNGPTNFDICAAPYGTGFFVSWWFGEQKLGCLARIALSIPIIGKIVREYLEFNSYYLEDTQSMFEHATHTAVLESIDAITMEKGLRVLTELERQPTNMRKR